MHKSTGNFIRGMLIAMTSLMIVSTSAAAEQHGKHHPHGRSCESVFDYQTLNWNPPFAEARLKGVLEKLAAAGQAGYKIAKSLPDGTGGEILILEKRIVECGK